MLHMLSIITAFNACCGSWINDLHLINLSCMLCIPSTDQSAIHLECSIYILVIGLWCIRFILYVWKYKKAYCHWSMQTVHTITTDVCDIRYRSTMHVIILRCMVSIDHAFWKRCPSMTVACVSSYQSYQSMIHAMIYDTSALTPVLIFRSYTWRYCYQIWNVSSLLYSVPDGIMFTMRNQCRQWWEINDGNVWTATSMLSMFINMRNVTLMLPDVVQTDDMYIDAVLWSIDVLVYHAMYIVHIIDQRRMLCMPSIDACYTCHQLCHSSNVSLL